MVDSYIRRPTPDTDLVGLITGPAIEITALSQNRANMDATVASENQTALSQNRANMDATVASENQTALSLTDTSLTAT